MVDCFTHCQELEWGFYSIFFAKCIFYMFELREKFEKNHFLAILTPQNCNLVGPRRPSGQFSEIRVPTQWNPNFGIVVHCILPLHCYAVSVVLSRQNRKSGIPDFRFFFLKNRKSGIPDFRFFFLWNHHPCIRKLGYSLLYFLITLISVKVNFCTNVRML